MLLIGNRSRGFTFVELMVTVVVLSVGLVFIIQGYMTAIDALNTAQIRLEVIPFLEAKMDEIETYAEENNGTIRTSSEGDFFVDSREATWNLDIVGVEEEEDIDLSGVLNEVRLKVSWQENNYAKDISLSTLLPNKK